MTMMISFTLFLISAVLLVVKKNNAAGVRCGIAGILFELVFSMAWFSAVSKGRTPWYALAFYDPRVVLTLAVGLGLTIANAVAYHRQKEEGYFD